MKEGIFHTVKIRCYLTEILRRLGLYREKILSIYFYRGKGILFFYSENPQWGNYKDLSCMYWLCGLVGMTASLGVKALGCHYRFKSPSPLKYELFLVALFCGKSPYMNKKRKMFMYAESFFFFPTSYTTVSQVNTRLVSTIDDKRRFLF